MNEQQTPAKPGWYTYGNETWHWDGERWDSRLVAHPPEKKNDQWWVGLFQIMTAMSGVALVAVVIAVVVLLVLLAVVVVSG